MTTRKTERAAAAPEISTVRRKAVSVSSERLVECTPLLPETALPLLIQPAVGRVSLPLWAQGHREFINARLREHGAILFRDFGALSAEAFEQFVSAVSGSPLEYRERSSPRSRVRGSVYTSTDHPPDQRIFLHNEHSYARTFPLKLFLGCLRPAQSGGETPLADTRKIFRRISAPTRGRFIEKGWMYVRNFGDGVGLPWQTVFGTDDRAAVEAYCRENRMGCEWKGGGRLRTRQVRPAVARHPQTGETVWFNHATFFHVTTLPPQVRQSLLAEFAEAGLPNHTYYGDGSPIEDEVMEELRAAYEREMVSFGWQEGDVVLLDNMLTSHGRAPYVGPRTVLFAMAEPYTRTDL